MAKNPARATRLNRKVSMEVATDSRAKKAAEQAANKAAIKSMGKPTTKEEKMKMAVAQIHARDSEAFKKHAETRADAPLHGVDQVGFIPATPSMSKVPNVKTR